MGFHKQTNTAHTNDIFSERAPWDNMLVTERKVCDLVVNSKDVPSG